MITISCPPFPWVVHSDFILSALLSSTSFKFEFVGMKWWFIASCIQQYLIELCFRGRANGNHDQFCCSCVHVTHSQGECAFVPNSPDIQYSGSISLLLRVYCSISKVGIMPPPSLLPRSPVLIVFMYACMHVHMYVCISVSFYLSIQSIYLST